MNIDTTHLYVRDCTCIHIYIYICIYIHTRQWYYITMLQYIMVASPQEMVAFRDMIKVHPGESQ